MNRDSGIHMKRTIAFESTIRMQDMITSHHTPERTRFGEDCVRLLPDVFFLPKNMITAAVTNAGHDTGE